MVWLLSGGLAVATLMIIGFLLLVLINGEGTFWPERIQRVNTVDGKPFLGEVAREELHRLSPQEVDQLPQDMAKTVRDHKGFEIRRLLHTGNFDLYGDDYKWIANHEIKQVDAPQDAWLFERLEWGPFFGSLKEVRIDGKAVTSTPEEAVRKFNELHGAARDRFKLIHNIEKYEIGAINRKLEQLRLNLRGVELKVGKDSPAYAKASEMTAAREAELRTDYQKVTDKVTKIRNEDARFTIMLLDVGGTSKEQKISDIVRAYPANQLGFFQRLGIYFSRWWEFLSDEPREANTQGGVWPAIFGTVTMTFVMALVVAPFGVIAALYLREYAKQGFLLSAIRIAINNLAGVPSIVFGVFGLGFFCYLVGGGIDSVFFPERLPSPTYGTGGILWASLTLALLTVPVVIVATEEALAAVPRSMREGSYACGASKWQTIRRIVLPRAMPGVMTGLILAMARGAGEVAPLMITGVVKLAPELPLDGQFPYVHLYRSFMHLGFHIYDVGFQSRNSEAGKPMVYTTTLLLVALIALLNLAAISIRSRLKKRFVGSQF